MIDPEMEEDLTGDILGGQENMEATEVEPIVLKDPEF